MLLSESEALTALRSLPDSPPIPEMRKAMQALLKGRVLPADQLLDPKGWVTEFEVTELALYLYLRRYFRVCTLLAAQAARRTADLVAHREEEQGQVGPGDVNTLMVEMEVDDLISCQPCPIARLQLADYAVTTHGRLRDYFEALYAANRAGQKLQKDVLVALRPQECPFGGRHRIPPACEAGEPQSEPRRKPLAFRRPDRRQAANRQTVPTQGPVTSVK
ncbi:hypothetical protein [Chachezhania antarctica]|uniref:hypothetical protein n=1 Tax=Chachezhania antarctica TaxID=2340860 RepID=UPI000EB512F5|nr:hypothetical protein [Chachezhania antarctica]|tara:strand:- start:843 stop:1499 length:657 start_codon:yes stop_codon:yes gene_type:complete